MSLAPTLGFPEVSPPGMLNRALRADHDAPLGWAMLLAGLAGLAVGYLVAAEKGLRRPGPSAGGLYGLALWLLTGAILMPLMGLVSQDQPAPGSVPPMPTRELMDVSPPALMRESFMMLHLGVLAPIGALLAWLLFGCVLGATSSITATDGRGRAAARTPVEEETHGGRMPFPAAPVDERWRAILAGEATLSLGLRLGRRLFALVPSPWRCKFCNAPFRGPCAGVFRWVGYGPSRKNPHICARCIERAPEGGALVPVTVLFADVRGYTALAEGISSAEATATLNRFYEAASRALLAHEAVLGQIAGDEVMALFVPGFAGRAYPRKAVAAARALLTAVGYGSRAGSWLEVGVGICSGEEYVGNVGGGGFKDFTALGDVTNTAARLQAHAGGGEIVICAATYRAVRDALPDAERWVVVLRGKRSPVEAFLITGSGSKRDRSKDAAL